MRLDRMDQEGPEQIGAFSTPEAETVPKKMTSAERVRAHRQRLQDEGFCVNCPVYKTKVGKHKYRRVSARGQPARFRRLAVPGRIKCAEHVEKDKAAVYAARERQAEGSS
jgi:hypothetical protein